MRTQDIPERGIHAYSFDAVSISKQNADLEAETAAAGAELAKVLAAENKVVQIEKITAETRKVCMSYPSPPLGQSTATQPTVVCALRHVIIKFSSVAQYRLFSGAALLKHIPLSISLGHLPVLIMYETRARVSICMYVHTTYVLHLLRHLSLHI